MNRLGARCVALCCLLLELCQGDNDRQPRNFFCYNDYIKEMTCTWEALPGDNCSVEYRLLYKQTMGIITMGTLRPYQIPSRSLSEADQCVCHIQADFVSAMQYQINVTYRDHVILSTSVVPAQTIKPLPPCNLTVSSTQGKIQHLMWEDDYTEDTYLHTSLQYQVSYNRLQGTHDVLVYPVIGKQVSLLGFLEGGYTYTIRVRAKPSNNYNGFWSNWSSEKQWTEGSPEHNLDSIIVPICLGVVVLIIMCHYFIRWVKRGIWDKIPAPKLSTPFTRFQEYFFDEKQLENCIVDKLVCSGPSRDTLWESRPDSCPSFPAFPAPSLQLLLPFRHDLRLGAQIPAPLFPLFPTIWPGLPPGGPRARDQLGGRGAGEGYSLFNSLVKPEPEGEGMVTEDRDSPLTLPSYSLATMGLPGSEYKTFSCGVNASLPQVGGEGHAETGWRKASDYMPCDQLAAKPGRAAVGTEEPRGPPEPSWPRGPGPLFPLPPAAQSGWPEAGAKPGAGVGTGPGQSGWWAGVSGLESVPLDSKREGKYLDLGFKGKCHPRTPEGEATPYMKLSLVGNEQSPSSMKLHPAAPQDPSSYRLTLC
ncbi:interleukin 4 receptor, tandem duplicate 1 isoform X2 [Callorhinchus milii]|uniref:interleukin 4 receptor, tandem duplicate 1 isoform X2 n=1 Tax=Callorhinchus milii TaxID=7868 RepID=UPI001C3FA072|nr:interleukin 4 receptor, tandem duplicate 1 isoform X2 [Callorhinchus milii]